MKVLAVLSVTAPVTALAYGGGGIAADVSAVIARASELSSWEPATLLLFGGLLIAAASLLRRLV